MQTLNCTKERIMVLSKQVKDYVLETSVNSVYRPKIEEVEKQLRKELAVYALEVGMMPASEIPEKWKKYITIKSEFSFRMPSTWKYLCTEQSFCYSQVDYKFTLDNESASKYLPSIKTYENLLEEKKSFHSDVKSVLASCSTHKQLLETAPELYKFVPIKDINSGSLVPVQVLNKVRDALSKGE